MADIVLINPRFDVSFWGLEHALPLFGKRANIPDVTCQPVDAATAKIKAAGFDVNVSSMPVPSQCPPGTVGNVDVAVGVDDEATLLEPEPHIPNMPAVFIAEVVAGAGGIDIWDKVDVPGTARGSTGPGLASAAVVPGIAVSPIVATVAGAAVPGAIPPPS